MNKKQNISLASVILAGFFATGCSQQQIQEPIAATPAPAKPAPVVVKPAPVVVKPAPVVVKPAPVVVKPAPRPRNPNCHTHPANSMTKSIQHCHKNPKGRHQYGKKVMAKHTPVAKPQVDVYALQRKLKAKGYYKGAIDGVVGSGTRDALKRFQNR